MAILPHVVSQEITALSKTRHLEQISPGTLGPQQETISIQNVPAKHVYAHLPSAHGNQMELV